MLTLCTAANTKTQIMHHANVSHSVMERYLADLEARDLIRHGVDDRGYALTTRGEELLRLLRRAHDLMYTPLEHAR